MTLQFHGGSVWEEITNLVKAPGQVHAAIAFVGKAAPELLPLRKGDVLIVNADKRTVAAHATNPYALEKYLQRGVAIYSSERLHAKVIATETAAVIGSANASATSAGNSEACIVVNDPRLVQEIKDFVLAEVDSSGLQIDKDELQELQKIFDESKPTGGIPTVTLMPRRHGLFQEPMQEAYLSRYAAGDTTEAERKAMLKKGRSEGKSSSLSAGVTASVIQIDKDSEPFEEGSILFLHNGKDFDPPALVASGLIEVQSGRRNPRFGQLLLKKSRQRTRSRATIQRHFVNSALSLTNLDLKDSNLLIESEELKILVSIWFDDFQNGSWQ